MDILTLKPNEIRPALSATNDLAFKSEPEPAQEPVEISEPVVAESEQVAAKADAVEDPAASEDHGDDTAAKPSRGVQKRIDELTKRNGDTERARDALAKENEELKRSREPVVVQDDPRPTRDDFDNPDDFESNLAIWGGRHAVREFQNNQAETAERSKQQDESAKLQAQWSKGEAEAIEKYPDFKEVVGNESIAISGPMAYAIPRHAQAHDIAYYLGKNPEEAARIALLGPAESAMEIGAIAYQLRQTKPEVSKAPSPVRPVGTSNASGRKSLDSMSMDEYAAQRKSRT